MNIQHRIASYRTIQANSEKVQFQIDSLPIEAKNMLASHLDGTAQTDQMLAISGTDAKATPVANIPRRKMLPA